MSHFRQSRNRTPYLFDGPHWRVEPIRDLEIFFSNLLRLVPEGGILCLAESAWSEEGRAFVRDQALPSDESHPLPSEFDRAPRFVIDAKSLALLSDMATRHAEPELAIHLGAYADGVVLLEWYDLPDDPISVSLSVPEERVAEFARGCGVGHRAVGLDPSQNRRTQC